MPLVKRLIKPIALSRRPSIWGLTEDGEEVTLEGEYDLTAVTNVTLCGALRQLANLVVAAQGVSKGLEEELLLINTRASALTSRLTALELKVSSHNPRTVPVPEGDLRTFSERKEHYEHKEIEEGTLFTEGSRPPELITLYQDAIETPVHIMREIDRLRDDGVRSSRYFMCEPVLGDSLKKQKLRKLNLEIETRRPASFAALREWCSDDETLTEQISLAPVSPSVPRTVVPPPAEESTPHKLPSPEQRVLALSLKYPPELVPIDVSGTGFKRLEKFRQSLIQFEYHKGKRRRKRVKRRNTIADTRDARIALADREAASTSSGRGISSPRSGSPSSRGGVSFTDRSFDTTETLDTTSNTTKTSSDRENQLHSLGIDINIPVPPRNVSTLSRRMAKEANSFKDNEVIRPPVLGSSRLETPLVNGTGRETGLLRNHLYETIKKSSGDNSADKRYPQKSLLPISTQSAAMNVAVKLREGTRDEATYSSSGNWSASSSTRTSVESDQQRPVASPTLSLEQDSIISESLQIRSSSPSSNQRTNSRTTDDFPSTSSHASDGTLTPTQDIQDIPFLDDDTSSAYSCDTEGYYTSFHIDSGLRSVSYEGNKLAGESDYETFGKGSTGTTNSSASLGTVVMRNPEKKTPPKPPQRVSSLERKRENRESVITVIHVNGSTSSREDVVSELPEKLGSQDGDSRSSRDGDSGRETSSSPTEPTSPRQPSLPSPEHEYSESDFEVERQEILRVKTSINSSRIPSMCVITPPQSDDESVRSGNVSLSRDSLGSQPETQGQQQVAQQGIACSNASQGSASSIGSKIQAFQNSGAKYGGASGNSKAIAEPEKRELASKIGATPHSYTPTLTVIPKGKDGDINAHLKGIMHTAAISSPARATTEQPVLIKPSLVRQAEKEKRLSQEGDIKQKMALQKQLSKDEGLGKSEEEKSQGQSSDLVSYKELPPPSSTSHPFSAVPSSVKQNVVITPTNSLERRKANTNKTGARVTLNSDGKVVYSSDSLPRRKGHSSFEPGPYIKQVVSAPQPQVSGVGGIDFSQTVTVSHMKTAVSTAPSSIQQTPLPPVPSQSSVGKETTTTTAVTTQPQPHPMAQRPQQPLPPSASLYHTSPPMHHHPIQSKPMSVSLSHSQPNSSSIPLQSSVTQSLPTSAHHISKLPTQSAQNTTLPSLVAQASQPPSGSVTQPHVAQAQPTAQSLPLSQIKTVLTTQVSTGGQPTQHKGSTVSTAVGNIGMSSSPLTNVNSNQQIKPSQPSVQQRIEQATQQPQSPLTPKQVAFANKPDVKEPEKQKLKSVAGSSNSMYAMTQVQIQQQLQQQQVQQQQLQQQQLQQQQQLKQQQQQQLQQLQQQQQQLIQQQQQHEQQMLQQQQQMQQQQQTQQQPPSQQQQQLLRQQQQIYMARQEAQRQLMQQQQQIYQTHQEAQRVLQQQHQQQLLLQQQQLYQARQDAQQARQQNSPPIAQAQQAQSVATATSTGVIMASQGAPMSPRSQRAGAYVHVQGQTTPVATLPQQGTQVNQSTAKQPPRPQSAHGYPPGGQTSRAPTPVQGPITSSPRRGAQPSTVALTHPNLRTDPVMMYGSQRSLQSVGLAVEGRGVAQQQAQQQQPPPRPMSTSPPPYPENHGLTDSDIYGRIGMTRHVQVGGTLPASFGRYQRGYSSLPPSRRQSLEQQSIPPELLQQQQQLHDKNLLTRRSSTISYTAGTDNRTLQRAAASNPSTPEKILDKKEKSSKKDKDKDKDKKKKEAKTEKSPKKKWFWTLPLRRKKKNKDENEDDDGGFKAASEKGARKTVNMDDSSFIRYPSPDTGSSDMNSSYSSELSGEHSYRSSPSAEVYYYSRRAQQQALAQHQQQQQQLQQQQQQLLQQQHQSGGGIGPRSLPTTPVSPPDSSQSSFVSVNPSPQSVMSDVTDLTVTDLSKGRRYMSREDFYAAMRHPQYYNYHRTTMTSATGEFGSQSNSTPTSRSQSPAVFGVNPPPPYAIRPQVYNNYGSWPPDNQDPSISRDTPVKQLSVPESQTDDEDSPTNVDPPADYQNSSGENHKSDLSKQMYQMSGKSSNSQQSSQNSQSGSQNSGSSTPKQTTRVDFKKMILNKSMSSAGGNQRISAVEMLKASRPSIYGYSPPPAPVVKPPQPQPPPPQSYGQGVIMPPSSRNTARALLFQSRFGSGRRFRAPKTEIISTTILEDHGGEEYEEYEEESEEEEDDEDDEFSSGSPERRNVQSVRGPLARAYSEPCSSSTAISYSPTSSPIGKSNDVAHSTPNTTLVNPPQTPDVSIIAQEEPTESKENGKSEADEKESMETAL